MKLENFQVYEAVGKNVFHIVPRNDLREHSCDLSKPCWCKPDVDGDHHGTLVVHNSMDRREDYEDGSRKLS